MLCEKPYMLGVMPCRCQKCLPCLIERRRIWASRLLIEAMTHGDSCFVTLTYDEKHRPPNDSLQVRDVQLWLKRLRKAIQPQKIRYYVAGEYGDETRRPHYHVALYGLDTDTAGGVDGTSGIVRSTWGNGYSFVGDLSPQSCAYIVGYVTKKMTSKDDWRLYGREPEFQRMSLRPGIGAGAVGAISEAVNSDYGIETVVRDHDVPHTLKRARKSLPLGRYLRGKLRPKVGFSSEKASDEAVKKYSLEMRALFEDAFALQKNQAPSLSKILVDMNKQKILNAKSRFKVFASKKVL